MNKFAWSVLTVSALALIGCEDGQSDGVAADGPGVAVIYQSDPLADVQVRLHESPSGPVVAQAVSAADGVARFSAPPNPEPQQYYVSLASLSDGGWMLDTKFLKADSGIQLRPLATNDGQRIELPRGAIRPLVLSK